MATVKLSKRSIDALSVERGDRVFWDRELPGFGVRVHATGRKVFVAQARVPGGLPKRAVIGRCVDMTAEAARKKAAEVVDRIRRGEDPAPPDPDGADAGRSGGALHGNACEAELRGRERWRSSGACSTGTSCRRSAG